MKVIYPMTVSKILCIGLIASALLTACGGKNGTTGPAGAIGPAGPGISWIEVTSPSIQAKPNQGYLANGSSQISFTLPANPSLGDIVSVTGVGVGGWKVNQNPGQYINTSSIDRWTASNAYALRWQAVASDSTGTKLAAVAYDDQIYTSNDSGFTWAVSESSPIASWSSIASDSTGKKLVAVVSNGYIYTSFDAGFTWNLSPTAQIANWVAVASDATGTNLIAAVSGGQIYTSNDSGQTWLISNATTANWYSVASDSTGKKLVAVATGGQIYTSADAGTTWNISVYSASANWASIASDSTGTNLIAAISGGQIYTSNDSGATWNISATGCGLFQPAEFFCSPRHVDVSGHFKQVD